MYNNVVAYMKYRCKKGFTVIELAVTLAILGISFSLTAVVVVTLNSTQQNTNTIVAINSDIQAANDLILDYVSFISLRTTNEAQFTYNSSDSSKVIFTNDSAKYILSFNNSIISAKTKDYSGNIDYFKYNKTVSVPNISSIEFSYTIGGSNSPDLLVATMKTSKSSESHVYFVRVK